MGIIVLIVVISIWRAFWAIGMGIDGQNPLAIGIVDLIDRRGGMNRAHVNT